MGNESKTCYDTPAGETGGREGEGGGGRTGEGGGRTPADKAGGREGEGGGERTGEGPAAEARVYDGAPVMKSANGCKPMFWSKRNSGALRSTPSGVNCLSLSYKRTTAYFCVTTL